jgi:hypothetical protein
MTKHTATPWKLLRHYDNKRSESIENRHTVKDDNGMNIARIWEPTGSVYTQAQQEANAAFIVTACNSHDELLEIVNKLATTNSNDFKSESEHWKFIAMLRIEARVAIAKAKGE